MTRLRLSALAALLVTLGTGMEAAALTIEYSPDRDPRLVECDRALYVGRRSEAQSCYLALVAGSDDPRIKADAARAVGDFRAANSYFQDAIRAYPEDPVLRTRWGELFLATHQNNEAVKLFQESLELDEDYAPAKLGLAKVAAGRFEQQTREWANEVIEEAPEHALVAYLLLARADLEDGAIDAADEKLDRALELAERTGASPLEIYAYKASVDLLRGTTQSQWTERARALNPNYGGIFETPAYFYVITRRYREAIELLRRAVEVEPDLYSAHAELGVNLLRENRVDEAQRHLEIAYRGDPYSAPIVNTLRLIDSFRNFVVSEHPPAEGASSAQPNVILRLHRNEHEVLTPYVLDLVRKSIDVYTERYGYRLDEPVIVELYPEHDDFAVRTSGLPGIGLLGVTFGHLVAMDSPTARSDSDFHWGTTLWHEMAHVFTLEATNHLVPRWFSEGVSVHEEWATGPLAGRHIPPPFFEALKEKKLLPVSELDRGFIRPTYDAQVIVSYMQAGLVCEYIAQRWGQQALEAMLRHYAEGKDTAEAIQGALQISARQFDEDFLAHVDGLFGEIAANLEQWQRAQQEAHRAASEEDWQGAIAAAERAIELHADYVDSGSAYLVKARAHKELGQDGDSIATLQEYHRRGGHDPDALLELSRMLTAADRSAEALAILEDVLMVAPLRPEVHAELGERLMAAGRPADAAVEFKALLAMKPQDMAAAHYRLANAYFRAGDRARSREHLLYALEIAPSYREAQQLLLEIVR